jgi:hypothetical protein
MPNFNSVKPIQFQMTDSAGAYQTGKTVTGFSILDKRAAVALAGTFTEVTNGGGTYIYIPVTGELGGDAYTLRFIAAACKDTFVKGYTSEGVSVNQRGEVKLNTQLAT